MAFGRKACASPDIRSASIVGIAPDGSFLAVALENERDEDLGGGRVGQLPTGAVFMVDLTADGLIACDAARVADVTCCADIAPEDPEPEFVSINGENEVVVTMQENSHIVVLSSAGEVLSHFSAGEVTLEGVDTKEKGALVFDQTIIDPEARPANKGVEPETVTFDVYDGTPYVFVGAERSSIIGVCDITDPAAPELTQLLPSGIGPKGYVTIPERNLLVSANEVDDAGAPDLRGAMFSIRLKVWPSRQAIIGKNFRLWIGIFNFDRISKMPWRGAGQRHGAWPFNFLQRRSRLWRQYIWQEPSRRRGLVFSLADTIRGTGRATGSGMIETGSYGRRCTLSIRRKTGFGATARP